MSCLNKRYGKPLIRMGSRLAALTLLAVALRLALFCVPLPLPEPESSVLIEDRHGRLLREAWSDARGAARPVKLDQVSPYLINATLAAEDHRFYSHWGVDLKALLGAAWGNARAGQVVAGGSTVTQQVVDALCGHSDGWGGKALQAARALRLESERDKARILELYLNLVPYGHNTRGAESAARYYFGRPALSLSLAQAALLAGLPRGPSLYDPLADLERARQRQRWILDRMLALEWIEKEAWQRACDEPLVVQPHPEEFLAPHFCDLVMAANPVGRVRTTLDADLQTEVEVIVRSQVRALADRGLNGAAVVVLDNTGGDVLAMVGSADYFDEAADGQVNLALSLRQPGSALKPFTYGLALERGLSPATLLQDEPVRYKAGLGEFAPTNYDGRFHGPVRLRTALASSYNVPAVRLAHRLGTERLLTRLREAGFDSLNKPAQHYGLSLTLGAGEVTLLELTRAYRALARHGNYSAHRTSLDERPGAEIEIFPPRVAFLLSDILSDPAARAPGFGRDSVLALPFPCAVKTGTSRAYRDNWTVGYTTRFTVGVWAGHTRGQAMQDVSGVAGAGPIFREVMLRLHPYDPPPAFPIPEGLSRGKICLESGLAAGPHCSATMLEWEAPAERCHHRQALRILSPAEGDSYQIDPHLPRSLQTLRLQANGPVEWRMDGRPADADWPLTPGVHEATAISAQGESVSVSFTVCRE